jgi:excisionase family DNA binding protein
MKGKLMKETNEGEKSVGQPYFTVRDIAERWGMSPRHVRREIAAGRLRTHVFGRALRISAADLLEYERSSRT